MILKLILLSLYILIPLIIFFKLFSMKHHRWVFLGAAAFAVFVAWYSGFTFHELGFRIDNILEADGYYYIAFFLSFGVAAYFKQNRYSVGYKKIMGKDINSYKGMWFVPAQEIIFRGVLFPLLLSFNISGFIAIAIMSFIFSFAHISFRSWKIVWLTLGMGIMLSTVYVIFPNIFLVTIAHGIFWLVAQHYKII